MSMKCAIVPATLLSFAALSVPVMAQESSDEPTATPFRVEGGFDFGFRGVDTSGNEDKYFEDLNLRTGPVCSTWICTSHRSTPSSSMR